MILAFSLHHDRFYLEPEGALQVPSYNKGSTPQASAWPSRRLTLKGNVIRDGFGSTFRQFVGFD